MALINSKDASNKFPMVNPIVNEPHVSSFSRRAFIRSLSARKRRRFIIRGIRSFGGFGIRIKMTKEGEEKIKMQEGEEYIEESKQKGEEITQEREEVEMIQEREKATLKTKSLSSQLKHIRDICHEGIIRLQKVYLVRLLGGFGTVGFGPV